MAIRKIRELNDEILRKRSKEVEIVDDKIKELIKDMEDTLNEYDGIGLAAVQVGVLKRVVIVKLPDEIETIKLINPKIVEKKGIQTVEEGCLSIPNHYAQVERPAELILEALDENGKNIKIDAKGILSVVLCHETDHLDGELFIDKMIPGTLEVVTADDINKEKNKK